MKNIFLLLLLVPSIFLANKLNIVVSIAPQLALVQKITKEKANVSLMVQQGTSPHTYEPRPSQMKDITNADIYYSIDLEFENVWLKRFQNLNKNMIVSNLTKDITKQSIHEHEHTNKNANQAQKQTKSHSLDPHIWTSPNNLKIIAKNILDTLILTDTKNKDYYVHNYLQLINELEALDTQILHILKDIKKDTIFMVFHPSWGYFASQYHLIQEAIEIEGKSPKPKELIGIIKEAKEENIQAIITSPEFSLKSAQLISKQLNIEVISISHLNQDYEETLIKLAKAIQNK